MFDASASQKIRDAAKRLRARGLLQTGDSLSQRLAGEDQIILLTVDADHRERVGVAQLFDPVLDGVYQAELLRQHQAIYLRRKDVGAILLNRQPWAAALRESANGMPGVFDEQIRHLGSAVQVMPQLDARSENLALLRKGENAFLLPEQVLCLGMTLDRVVFNAELLEKCAKAFVLASSTGKPVGQIPWLVRFIANRRLLRDERHAAQQYVIGQLPVFKSAY